MRAWLRAPAFAGALGLAGCATANVVAPDAGHAYTPDIVSPQPAPPPAVPPPQFQFLYGSAEAAALSEQAYNGLLQAVTRTMLLLRPAGADPADGVPVRLSRRWTQAILAPGSTVEQPLPMSCEVGQPLAVVVDIDETALLNLGYERLDAQSGSGFDAQRWDRWERTGASAVAAVPGAARAFAMLRRIGVTVVANSNRSAANAVATQQALANAGLGAFRHGETLFLKGDADGKSAKDGRRAAIAARFCVLALAGDQLGDFADIFNPSGSAPAPGRRASASAPGIAARWGSVWFMLPNPVYGTGLGSGWLDTFPADKQWSETGK